MGGGYQSSIHWPHCIDSQCTGCMPDLPILDHVQLIRCIPALGIHERCSHTQGPITFASINPKD